jgi:hypothetical protein
MPDDIAIRKHAVATAPEFFAHVARAFAFLTSTYAYRLANQDITAINDVRDTRLIVTYLHDHVDMEVDVIWDVQSVSVNVLFATPAQLAQGDHVGDVAKPRQSRINLEDLAAVRGHADDPDFMQGDVFQVHGRIINKRFQFIQAHLTDIIDGLARATERYADDVLRGDTSIFPEVQAHYRQRMQARTL